MSSVKEHHYVISDLHLGHKNIIKYCRQRFVTIEEHDQTIIQNIQKLTSEDVLWVLGDVAMNVKALRPLKDISCRLGLICGNHDNLGHKEYGKYFFQIRGCAEFVYQEKKVLLTHIPIHPSEKRWDYIVHGHTHQHDIDDLRYINVVCERLNYQPQRLSKVLDERISTRNRYAKRSALTGDPKMTNQDPIVGPLLVALETIAMSFDCWGPNCPYCEGDEPHPPSVEAQWAREALDNYNKMLT